MLRHSAFGGTWAYLSRAPSLVLRPASPCGPRACCGEPHALQTQAPALDLGRLFHCLWKGAYIFLLQGRFQIIFSYIAFSLKYYSSVLFECGLNHRIREVFWPLVNMLAVVVYQEKEASPGSKMYLVFPGILRKQNQCRSIEPQRHQAVREKKESKKEDWEWPNNFAAFCCSTVFCQHVDLSLCACLQPHGCQQLWVSALRFSAWQWLPVCLSQGSPGGNVGDESTVDAVPRFPLFFSVCLRDQQWH